MAQKTIIVTVVGDGTVGKTCLINKFIGEEFKENYIPTVLQEVNKSLGNYNLHINDTAGQEEYARLRPLAYPQTNVFIICFSLTDMDTYKNVKIQWCKELHHYAPNVPCILVGTKLDDVKNQKVSRAEGLKLQRAINASFYVECSAKDGRNIKEVFENAVKAYLSPTTRKKRRYNCFIL